MALFDRSQLRDEMNKMRTSSLFVEFPVRGKSNGPLMTLRDVPYTMQDGTVLPSLREIYMQFSDPTEYSVAMHVLGDWNHWQRLTRNKNIMEYIQLWRDELEVKLRSEAIRGVVEVANGTSQSKLGAAKYIAEGGWKEKKAGRPTKGQINKQAKIEARIKNEVDEDLERLGLH